MLISGAAHEKLSLSDVFVRGAEGLTRVANVLAVYLSVCFHYHVGGIVTHEAHYCGDIYFLPK